MLLHPALAAKGACSPTMSAPESQPPDATAGRRRHSRLRLYLPATLITLNGTLPVTLLDLSFRGARIALGPTVPRAGASAVLTWASFEAFCTVTWSAGGSGGLDFDVPLHPQVLLATRDLADRTPHIDSGRLAARDWATGRVNRL